MKTNRKWNGVVLRVPMVEESDSCAIDKSSAVPADDSGVTGAPMAGLGDPVTETDTETDTDTVTETDTGTVTGTVTDPVVYALEEGMDRTAQCNSVEDEEDEEGCFSLRPQFAPSAPIPDDALPSRMAAWAEAAATTSRGTYAVAAMMVVSFMDLLMQPHGNVQMWGRPKPLSFLNFIISASGSKKTTIYLRLAEPINAFESQLESEFAAGQEEAPLLLVQDTTEPATTKYLQQSLGSMGLFVDEAGLFLGSHAMQRDNFLGMVSLLSKLYDGAPIAVQRVGRPRIVVRRKRFTVMLASPLRPFIGLLGNAAIREQGLLSRALITAPAIEKRRKASPEAIAAAEATLRDYDRFVATVLSRELPIVAGTRNDLDPPLLVLTPEAEAAIDAFQEEVSAMRDALSENDPILDVSNKAVELSGRLAGVFALAEDIDTRVVDAAAVAHGISLSRHAMHESIRLVAPTPACPHADLAERIAQWMARKGLQSVGRSQLQSASLGRKYTVAEFAPAIKLLVDSRWLREDTVPRRDGRRGGRDRHVYHLTRAAMRELKFPGA